MSLQEQLQAELLDAVRSKDDVRRSALRMLKSSILYAEKAKGEPLDDAELVQAVSREVRSRKESIEEFRKADRTDLLEREEAELAVIMAYMPEQMSREEISEVARRVIGEVGAQGPGDKGKVMGKLMGQLKGKADGREVNEVVTGLLQPLES